MRPAVASSSHRPWAAARGALALLAAALAACTPAAVPGADEPVATPEQRAAYATRRIEEATGRAPADLERAGFERDYPVADLLTEDDPARFVPWVRAAVAPSSWGEDARAELDGTSLRVRNRGSVHAELDSFLTVARRLAFLGDARVEVPWSLLGAQVSARRLALFDASGDVDGDASEPTRFGRLVVRAAARVGGEE